MTNAKNFASNRLIVFAKAPVLGEVKTRLQPDFSIQQSVLLHRRLVEFTLATALKLKMSSKDLCIELWVGDEHPWWMELSSRYSVVVYKQQGEDLGARMAHAFNQALLTADKAVIIGCDCPFISESYLYSAFDQLTKNQIVIGPAADGGYVLLGMKTFESSLFNDIKWGGDKVLSQTLNRAADKALIVKQLPVLRDIDRLEDVHYLHQLIPELTDSFYS